MTFCNRAVFVLLILAQAKASTDPASLREDPSIKAAFAAIVKNEPEMLNEEARICEIPRASLSRRKAWPGT